MTQLPSVGLLLAAKEPTFTPGPAALDILELMAWCVSAAGVFGLLVVGINMALQLRRGDPGEGGDHFRGIFFVALASVVATTAGPLVRLLGDITL
ncbi:hypothetical protein ACIQNG_05095 [Streptomyces sp. NPDC091377]|uniref:hypothetical protein n=1 Tax=unclassified Streptomyces TaxID=2593676 RepID=UPI0038106E84